MDAGVTLGAVQGPSSAVASPRVSAEAIAASLADGVAATLTSARDTVASIAESLQELRPRLRGWLHLAMVPVVIASIVTLSLQVPLGGATGFAVGVYGVTALLVFTISAVYHRWGWPSRHRSWWQRADHSAIFLFIAGTATPVTVVAVDAPWSLILLTGLWGGAAYGVIRVWRHGVRSHLGPLYAGLGWAGVLVSAQFLSVAGGTAFTLLLVGGICYSVGAWASFKQWPNPWPRTFGYHEVFHVCTVVAAACQFLAIVIALPQPVSG